MNNCNSADSFFINVNWFVEIANILYDRKCIMRNIDTRIMNNIATSVFRFIRVKHSFKGASRYMFLW